MINRLGWKSLLLMWLIFNVNANSEELIYVDESVPPLMYNAGGTAMGIYPALLGEISRRSGIELKVVAIPWKRALRELDAGRGGNGALYKNSERITKYDFSEKLFDEVQILYVRTGHEFAFTGLDSLRGKTIGVIRGWSYGDKFDMAVKSKVIFTEEVGSDEQNFEKLILGRVDAIISIREAAAATIAAGKYEEKVSALSPPLSVSPAYIAFSKSAHKTDVINKLNRAIKMIRADGSFGLILSSVFVVPPAK